MEGIVVGLDLHLKKTEGSVMSMSGEELKHERFDSTREGLQRFLASVPQGTEVAIESLGFCWPWIDFIEELGYKPLLANPIKVKARAEDVKTDKVDSELLAHLTRVDWLPTVYIPSTELRMLRSFLRHRAFRRRISTALKNRSWSEFHKRWIDTNTEFRSKASRRWARTFDVYEIGQNMDILDLVEEQIKEIDRELERRYADIKPVQILRQIPGIGILTALTIYAEVCDIKRFSTPDKLAHYAGLVPTVRQSGEKTKLGRMTRGKNKWLKNVMIEAAWSHIRWCPDGRLAGIYKSACLRKKDETKAIKIVARKLVNVVWAVWTHETDFVK